METRRGWCGADRSKDSKRREGGRWQVFQQQEEEEEKGKQMAWRFSIRRRWRRAVTFFSRMVGERGRSTIIFSKGKTSGEQGGVQQEKEKREGYGQ